MTEIAQKLVIAKEEISPEGNRVVYNVGRPEKGNVTFNMGRGAKIGAGLLSLEGVKEDVLTDASDTVLDKIGEVELTGMTAPAKLGVGLKAYFGAEVKGLKHISRSEISVFDERTYDKASTFGKGLYLGANRPIATTDLEMIRNGEHYVHEVGLTGNILSIDLSEGDMGELAAKLPDEAYTKYLEHGGSFDAASLLMDYPIDGVTYDAMVFHRTTESPSGPIVQTEAIVRDPSRSATLVSSTHVS